MTVTAPPRPPTPPAPHRKAPDDLEALIEEARRRAHRRRLRNAAALVAVGLIVLAAFGAQHLGRGGSAGQVAAAVPPPKPLPPRALPANGEIAVVRRNALVAMSPDGAHKRLLTTCPRISGDCNFGNFAWSPNGQYLAFLAGHFGGAVTLSNLSLYIVRANGTDRRLLARCGDCGQAQGQEFSWAPDSRRIALAADVGLYVVDVASGALHPLSQPASTVSAGTAPAWSPAGARIALAVGRELYTVRPDGSGLARIAAADPAIDDPVWSPDGTKIAFDTPDDVDVVTADGSHLIRVLRGSFGSGPGTPSWSPNGRRILFFYTPGTPSHFTGQVWSMKPDGSDRRRLYDAGCCVGEWAPPIWSPDGRWIALSGATETDGVVVMDARGEHRRQLLAMSSIVAWQPLPRR